jgi:hypothetical protein
MIIICANNIFELYYLISNTIETTMLLINVLKKLGLLKENDRKINIKAVQDLWNNELSTMQSPSEVSLNRASRNLDSVGALLILRATLSPSPDNVEWVNAQLDALRVASQSTFFKHAERFATQLSAFAEAFAAAPEDSSSSASAKNL